MISTTYFELNINKDKMDSWMERCMIKQTAKYQLQNFSAWHIVHYNSFNFLFQKFHNKVLRKATYIYVCVWVDWYDTGKTERDGRRDAG